MGAAAMLFVQLEEGMAADLARLWQRQTGIAANSQNAADAILIPEVLPLAA